MPQHHRERFRRPCAHHSAIRATISDWEPGRRERPLSQSLFPRRYHNFWCAVRRPSPPPTCMPSMRRRGVAAPAAAAAVEVAYLGSDISVKFHRSLIAARDRLLPPLLRVAIYLIHCLETLNPEPAAASCTTVENRPLQCGTSNATMTVHILFH